MDLILYIKEQVRSLGSQQALARELSVNPHQVNDLVRGKCGPGAAMLRALGLKRVVRYKRVKSS